MDLIVRAWLEIGVGQRMLGADGIAEIAGGGRQRGTLVVRGEAKVGVDVKKLAQGLRDFKVEIEQKFPFFLKEGPDVVGQEVEERAVAIGAEQGVPVLGAPFSVEPAAINPFATAIP